MLTEISRERIVALYNKLSFFEKALDSAINQLFSFPYEIMIVDNNGKDNVIEDFYKIITKKNDTRISYYRNDKNIGMFGNWNRCIELCKSNLLVFLHDDDVLENDCLETLYNCYLINNGNSIFAAHSTINDNGDVINKYIYDKKTNIKNVSLFDIYLGKSVSTGCGCLLLKNQLIEIGGFNEDYYPASDWVVNILLSYKYGSQFLRKSTAFFRVGENNTSSHVYEQYPDILYFYRKCLSKYIKIPSFFLSIFTKILRKRDIYMSYTTWGNGSIKVNDLNILEKLIIRLLFIISELKWLF